MAVMVDLFWTFGLITGELLSTEGQLEPSYARYKGCLYARKGCQQFVVDEAGQQAMRDQLHSGAKRLQLPCPFPDVVAKVREATAKKGTSQDPKVSLLEIEEGATGSASRSDRQHVATGALPRRMPRKKATLPQKPTYTCCHGTSLSPMCLARYGRRQPWEKPILFAGK
jgi:hypothetical protein